MARYPNPWAKLGWDAWRLGLESAQVIALRTARLAAGDSAAATEAGRMVGEKVDAAVALQAMALTGALGLTLPRMASKTMAHYRRRVGANRRRLSRR
jgi:hypothetical protein